MTKKPFEAPEPSGESTQNLAAANGKFDAHALFEANKNSVVNIFAPTMFGPAKLERTLGSGFIIQANDAKSTCRIATDEHVLASANGAQKVRFADGSSYKATVEVHDFENDLSILRIDGVQNASDKCKALRLGNETESAPAVGTDVVKLTARMVSQDYTSGPVAEYFVRKSADQVPLLPGENPDRKMMLVRANGETGDSGGPILNAEGTVVGVEDISGGAVLAATPAHHVKRHLENLQAKDKQN